MESQRTRFLVFDEFTRFGMPYLNFNIYTKYLPNCVGYKLCGQVSSILNERIGKKLYIL